MPSILKNLIKELESNIESMRASHELELKDLKTKLTEESDNNLSTLKQKYELKLASLKVISSNLKKSKFLNPFTDFIETF